MVKSQGFQLAWCLLLSLLGTNYVSFQVTFYGKWPTFSLKINHITSGVRLNPSSALLHCVLDTPEFSFFTRFDTIYPIQCGGENELNPMVMINQYFIFLWGPGVYKLLSWDASHCTGSKLQFFPLDLPDFISLPSFLVFSFSEKLLELLVQRCCLSFPIPFFPCWGLPTRVASPNEQGPSSQAQYCRNRILISEDAKIPVRQPQTFQDYLWTWTPISMWHFSPSGVRITSWGISSGNFQAPLSIDLMGTSSAKLQSNSYPTPLQLPPPTHTHIHIHSHHCTSTLPLTPHAASDPVWGLG